MTTSSPFLQDIHVAVDTVHDMKLCCAMIASLGTLWTANQQMSCPHCKNTLKTKLTDFAVWGEKPANPTLPRKLASGVGVVMALYARPQWTENRVERDLAARNLPHGRWEIYRNTLIVLERPLAWIERGTLTRVSPAEARDVHLMVAKMLPEFSGRQVTDADLQADIRAIQEAS